MAKSIYTTPRHSGGWQNRIEGTSRPFGVYTTKLEAEQAGRRTALKRNVDHIVLGGDSQVQHNQYHALQQDLKKPLLSERRANYRGVS